MKSFSGLNVKNGNVPSRCNSASDSTESIPFSGGAIVGLVFGCMLISAGIATTIRVIRKQASGTQPRNTRRNERFNFNFGNWFRRRSGMPKWTPPFKLVRKAKNLSIRYLTDPHLYQPSGLFRIAAKFKAKHSFLPNF